MSKEYIVKVDEQIAEDGSQKILEKEELVRCKDCVYWNQIAGSVFGRCNVFNKEWHPGSEWYCADGVKKDA